MGHLGYSIVLYHQCRTRKYKFYISHVCLFIFRSMQWRYLERAGNTNVTTRRMLSGYVIAFITFVKTHKVAGTDGFLQCIILNLLILNSAVYTISSAYNMCCLNIRKTFRIRYYYTNEIPGLWWTIIIRIAIHVTTCICNYHVILIYNVFVLISNCRNGSKEAERLDQQRMNWTTKTMMNLSIHF